MTLFAVKRLRLDSLLLVDILDQNTSLHHVHSWETVLYFELVWPTQTGELCVAVFHWTVCRDGVCGGIYTPAGVGGRGAGSAGPVSALCFGLHCLVVWATEGLTHRHTVIHANTKRGTQLYCITYAFMVNVYVGVKKQGSAPDQYVELLSAGQTVWNCRSVIKHFMLLFCFILK